MIQNRIHKHIVLHENDEIKKFQDRIVGYANKNRSIS